MPITLWIAEVVARGVMTGFIRKDTLQHQYFLTQGMIMGGKSGSGVITNDTGGMTMFRFLPGKRLAPYSCSWTGHPVLLVDVNHDPLFEIHIQQYVFLFLPTGKLLAAYAGSSFILALVR